MRKVLLGCGLLLFASSLPGWAQDTFPRLLEEMLGVINRLSDTLEKVTDKKSAEAALPKIKDLAKELKALEERGKKLGKPTPEQEKEFKAKYEEKLQAAFGRFIKESIRLATVDGAKEILDELNPGRPKGQPSPGGKEVLKVEGKLAKDDPKDKVRKDSFHKVHTFKMVEGVTYTIDLVGTIDTYLRLEDSTGKELADDDDGGEGLNARIVFKAPRTDTYRIIATTFDGGVTGNYTLTIREAAKDNKK